MEEPVALIIVDGAEIIVLVVINWRVKPYKMFLGEYAPKDTGRKVSGTQAAKFFTQELLDNLSSKNSTNCD